MAAAPSTRWERCLAFTEAPGVVLRCPNCQSVLVVAVRTERAVRVSFSRLRWIEPAE